MDHDGHCPRCGRNLGVVNFYRETKKEDGFYNICKDCSGMMKRADLPLVFITARELYLKRHF